jgi:hypothetical protein
LAAADAGVCHRLLDYGVYATALGEAGRHALAMVILPILLTIVITIIADLDHPQRGLIKVSQQSMVDLQNTLKKY